MKRGTLVWLAKNDYESSLKNVGTIIAPVEDEAFDEETYYVASHGTWFLRSAKKLRPLTMAEKVLYMLESGEQCK